MSNSKFTLYVSDKSNPKVGTCLNARVFSSESLEAVIRGIDSGIFGHYGKKRYFLVPLGDLQLTGLSEDPQVTSLAHALQLFPCGGSKLVNPDVLGAFLEFPFGIARK